MKEWFSKDKLKKAPMMIAAVITMGICVALLKMTAFGPDPCSTMNYGMSALVGLPFGVYQMIVNIIVFIAVFFIDRSLLGLGSFGNMILVGYSADLTSFVCKKAFGITAFESTSSRVTVMLITLVIFVFAAAIYMNSGLGTAPYDALSILIHQKLFVGRNSKVPFRAVRILYDGAATLIGFVTGGGVGIVTLIMIPALGSAVDLVGHLIKRADQTSSVF